MKISNKVLEKAENLTSGVGAVTMTASGPPGPRLSLGIWGIMGVLGGLIWGGAHELIGAEDEAPGVRVEDRQLLDAAKVVVQGLGGGGAQADHRPARAASAHSSLRRHSQKNKLCSVESIIFLPASSQISHNFVFLTFNSIFTGVDDLISRVGIQN
mgnify:CR=1 FL=1